ncbi:hypothetical protein [Flavobacterium sp. 3HN19-14]|uniref:hypothetical protein n=1 Tax=Flavobacterium sp. 3HN19-14 TaxID=3448133 RepID=UPI003EDF914F
MELKTSWVEASTLKDVSSYIVIDAIIPTYTKTKTAWIISKQTKTKLALIGMHIVGSTAGHPEMIWSTFEHKKVAPNLEYTYLDKDSIVKTRAADTGNDWILNSNSADTTYNHSHMKYKGDSIYADFPGAPANNTVSPSNTKRTKPWGFANGGVPNRQTATVAEANSQVISINNSIDGMLVGNDVRKNYMFVGSTWTRNGFAPDGTSYAVGNTQDGTAVGGSQLANATMETYIQNGVSYNLDGSCFNCHHDYKSPKPTLLPDYLSHIFNDLIPLYTTAPDGKFFNRNIESVRTEPTTAKRS